MAAASGGIIKRNPLELIDFSGMTPTEDIISYLRYNFRRIEENAIVLPIGGDDRLQCRLMRAMLEVPVHLARNMLVWMGLQGGVDTKRVVIDLYSARVGGRCAEVLTGLTAADDSYTQCLVEQVDMRVGLRGQARYEEELYKIKRLGPKVLEFLELNAEIVMKKL